MAWSRGEIVVRREVWRGTPWLAAPVVVVEDAPDLLVTYLPEGAGFAFPPSADGRPHPWSERGAWEGHGVLMLQRPREAYAVWHFWDGPSRRFAGWYVNLQEPFRRTRVGYDTQDLELDVWIPVGEKWRFSVSDFSRTPLARRASTCSETAPVPPALADGLDRLRHCRTVSD